MPIRLKGDAGPAPAPTTGGGIRLRAPDSGGALPEDYQPPVAPPAAETPGVNPALMVGGVAALGGLAYAGSKMAGMPGALGKIGKVARLVNALRQQAMLSGFALPKSMLGDVGAAVNASAERGSMAPLKALLSRQTLQDAVQSFKTGSGAVINPVGHTTNLPKALSLPGRAMGAFDEATQKALQRGGLTAEEAMRETLQAPLTGGLSKAFQDNPWAQYLIPFRRTPFNQLTEGLLSMSPEAMKANPRVTAAYMALGAGHGAATADDPEPYSIPLAIAGAGRRGLLYGLTTIAGRALAGGKPDSAAASSMTPISDYGITSSITDPTRAFRQPAALSALKKMGLP